MFGNYQHRPCLQRVVSSHQWTLRSSSIVLTNFVNREFQSYVFLALPLPLVGVVFLTFRRILKSNYWVDFNIGTVIWIGDVLKRFPWQINVHLMKFARQTQTDRFRTLFRYNVEKLLANGVFNKATARTPRYRSNKNASKAADIEWEAGHPKDKLRTSNEGKVAEKFCSG